MSSENKRDEETTKNLIIKHYKEIVSSEERMPIYTDFLSHEITRNKIRHHFGGIENLHEYMKTEYPELLQKYFSQVQDIFSPERKVKTDSQRYFITTAVADSKVDMEFYQSIRSYCQKNDAQLVIMPCESITNSFENKRAIFDPVFNDPGVMVVSEDVELNNNFSLCSIQVSAKQIKSITGLSRLGNREGSYVFASPKQFLEYVPSGNNRGKNYAIMTPGACTRPSYYTETFVSKRLSYIAHSDHTMGGIIVEIRDDTLFDFRQVQADEHGTFVDMGIEYKADGSTRSVPVNIILGDLHSTFIDDDALEFFMNQFERFQVKRVFLHDVFDAYSISHHIKDISERADRSNKTMDSLEEELRLTVKVISGIEDRLQPEEVVIVKSNHDEFLDRYLAAGNYVYDPKNHLTSLKIAPALFQEKDVLCEAFEYASDTACTWTFLDRETSYCIADVECGAHGDLGMNGARPSLNSLEKIYGNCVTGHSHSAAIQRGVFRVGTLTQLNMRYNRGPSSWTHTSCLLYENGQRQLINYIT